MTLIVMMILLPIQTGSIETGWFSLRQTGKSQKASPSCPYGFSSMTLIVLEKRKRLIPKGDIETQSIAQRQHPNLSCCLTPWSGGVRWSSAPAAALARLFHPFKEKLILPPSLAELVVGVRIRIDIKVVDWEPPVCANDARG